MVRCGAVKPGQSPESVFPTLVRGSVLDRCGPRGDIRRVRLDRIVPLEDSWADTTVTEREWTRGASPTA